MYCPECNTEEGTPHAVGCTRAMETKLPSPIPFDLDGAEERITRLLESKKSNAKPDLETPGAVAQIENGDCYDEDTGIYLGQLTDTETAAAPALQTLNSLPAQISIFYEGYWYIFKPQSKYKEEKEGEKQT